MSRRVVIGNNGDGGGIWVSKAGFDALSAVGDSLLLSLDGGTEQIIMTGLVSPLPQTVVLGLSQRPYVFLTSVSSVPVQISADNGSQFVVSGLARPYPFSSSTAPNSSADVTASSMTISGGSSSVYYIVVRRAVS